MSSAKAISKGVRVSPRKMRLYADAIRGNNLGRAFTWLGTRALKRVEPLKKLLHSAYHNAKQGDSSVTDMSQLTIKEIRVDQGPVIRYFKAGAMGRVSPQRRRMSHLAVTVEKINDKR